MKLTKGTLAVAMAMMTGGAWAQNPNIINNVQSKMAAVQQQQTADSNAALGMAAKPAAAQSPAKPATGAPDQPAAMTPAAPAKSTSAPVVATAKQHPAAAPKKKTGTHPVIAAKEPAPKKMAKKADPFTTKIAADTKPAGEVTSAEAAKPPKPEEKKWAMSGKRDPFFSPVVQQPSGSGCSTGKKCLEIGQINLRGVVKSETGFIAVVTNSMNKAYFLHENDPVFNGYVIRITGDSVVFQETVQDKLGKPLTREVVKRIFTPAV